MAEEQQKATTSTTGDSVPATNDVAKKTPEPVPAEKKDEEAVGDSEKPAGEAPAANEEPAKPTEPAEEPKPADSAEEPKPADFADTEKPEAEKEPAGTAEEPAEPAANGTPVAETKKATGKRKSIGGAESRKLNKKKSSARITHLDAQPGEYYFARMKGYPPWPAIICDEEMLPQTLLNTRPTSTKQADGTYKELYVDGGKRVYDRTFPIMYLHTNEFAWIKNTELSPLNPEDCKNAPEKGKSKALIEAYKVAGENHDLQHFKDILADHQRMIEEEERAREEREAAKAAKKSKGKRKSIAAKDEDGDLEMADSSDEKPKSSKKRKKDADSDGEADKPAKTPKTTKLKLTTGTPKTPTAKGKKTAESAKGSRSKASKKGAEKTPASDEDEEMAESPKPEKTDAEAARKREQRILFLRHRLQRGFLSRDQQPKEEEMEAMSGHLAELETYTDLEVGIIRTTKINKVLKGIIKLATIPREEEFSFKNRSIELLRKWKSLLESDFPSKETKEGSAEAKDEAKEGAEKPEEAKPAENGVEKDVNGKPEEPTKAADEDVEMADAADAAPAKADAPEPTEQAEESTKEADAPAAEAEAEASKP